MWIERDLTQLNLPGPTALTIGAFDGVHRGHQALIRQLVTGARAGGMPAVVLTFDPLPRQVFSKAPPLLLSSLEERLTYLETLAPAGVVILPFSLEMADTSAQDFVTLLIHHLKLAALWTGPDFTLGRHRAGDLHFLRQAGTRLGFRVHTCEPFLWQGKPVHSTVIRRALLAGRLVEANELLGRPYRLAGTIVHGTHRGRTLGFPTANLNIPVERLLPAQGVYICRAQLAEETYGAVTNVGTRPTFDHGETTVEAHLLDFSRDIYGQRLRLDFLARLRPESKFASAHALSAQLRQDVAQARAWLAEKR